MSPQAQGIISGHLTTPPHATPNSILRRKGDNAKPSPTLVALLAQCRVHTAPGTLSAPLGSRCQLQWVQPRGHVGLIDGYQRGRTGSPSTQGPGPGHTQGEKVLGFSCNPKVWDQRSGHRNAGASKRMSDPQSAEPGADTHRRCHDTM